MARNTIRLPSRPYGIVRYAIRWFLAACLFSSLTATAQEPSQMNHTSTKNITVLYTPEFIEHQGIAITEQKLIQQFAENNSIEIEWKKIPKKWNLIAALLNGEGDMIIGQGTELSAGMDGQYRQTMPWSISAKMLVVRKDTTHINRLEDLYSRQVALKKSSEMWPLLEGLAETHIGMSLITIPERMSEKEILDKIDSGIYDVTVIDSLYLRSAMADYPNLSISMALSKPKHMAWMTANTNTALADKLNEFLATSHLSLHQAATSKADLPEMKASKVLRLISYQSPTNIYFKTGRLFGFEYDLIQRFADEHKMEVNLVLASSHTEMQNMLINGEGDIIAAAVPEDSIFMNGLSATLPYLYAAPVIIGRSSDEPIIDISDLQGRRVTLPLESPYKRLLTELAQTHAIDFEIVDAESTMNTEATLYMVAQGMYDLTVISGHKVKSELAQHSDLKAHFSLSNPQALRWFVREDDRKLTESLNQFIVSTYRSEEYWTLHSKYIARPKVVRDAADRISINNTISPYDELIKEVAHQYGFDWRLIAAQMYQESQFDPNALSYAGAEGLMQIMPETAQELGLESSMDPEQSIRAGVHYLSKLRALFGKELLAEEQSWFSLAAYNAGLGRIAKAQKKAETMGLDSKIWFNNVETALLEMAQSALCRCGQTIIYVREIRSLYTNYVTLLEASRYISSRQTQNRDHDS